RREAVSIPICVGTIIVATQRPRSTLRPRNRSLAKANPASVQKLIVDSVTAEETNSELSSHWVRGASLSTSRTLSKMLSVGRSGGVDAAISALVSDAITNV